MNNIPSITVVIPAYNEEQFLPKCLDSLQNQTFKDFEIIVVDNNSTDKTAEIAKKYQATVINESKQGIAYARDCGFKKARASIIARTDADTITPPYWLQVIWDEFKNNPDIIGLTGPSTSFDGGKFINFIHKYLVTWWIEFGKILMGHYQLNGPNFAIKKSVFLKINNQRYDNKIH